MPATIPIKFARGAFARPRPTLGLTEDERLIMLAQVRGLKSEIAEQSQKADRYQAALEKHRTGQPAKAQAPASRRVLGKGAGIHIRSGKSLQGSPASLRTMDSRPVTDVQVGLGLDKDEIAMARAIRIAR